MGVIIVNHQGVPLRSTLDVSVLQMLGHGASALRQSAQAVTLLALLCALAGCVDKAVLRLDTQPFGPCTQPGARPGSAGEGMAGGGTKGVHACDLASAGLLHPRYRSAWCLLLFRVVPQTELLRMYAARRMTWSSCASDPISMKSWSPQVSAAARPLERTAEAAVCSGAVHACIRIGCSTQHPPRTGDRQCIIPCTQGRAP